MTRRGARIGRTAAACVFAAMLALASAPATGRAAPDACIPPDSLGDFKWERVGTHDAANIRTEFWNFGMVGGYPRDPGNVDLSVFHSAEVPKGSGMNYSDGITPFVLAKVPMEGTFPPESLYIMETGFRERQAISASHPGELQMRFEPRRGYFQEDPAINRALSPAISNDPRTWPAFWPDMAADSADVGWRGSWNGYFGKRPAADQESFFVMDDNYYDAFGFQPDTRCDQRYGLGLRVEARGFQWANPQAGNVIFWHYDIVNEGTTDFDNNVIFGLYMDSGVGGSAQSCDGVFESDDDNAFFDRSLGLNLVYTWDKCGHGKDLAGDCSATGYLGYAYLETPGNPYNGVDDDRDGITDELRDGGKGEKIVGRDAIRAYILSHPAQYDLAKFEAFYGPLEQRPAYRVGEWWTGDEDMDWVAEFNDTGRDGVFGSSDPVKDGERDGEPTDGEANFDRTDVNESDQIGLTGFKMNRIAPGKSSDRCPSPPATGQDGIVFFTEQNRWPEKLYNQFTSTDSTQRFDVPQVLNYNIAFLFASGPFKLPAGKRERFSLALAYGADLSELRENVHVVQQIYDANYQFAVPPPRPTVRAETGDRFVRLSWDDVAERASDPVTGLNDFEGYRIYRSTDPEFRDPRVITTGRGNPLGSNGKPIVQFDLVDQLRGYSRTKVDGVAYWLGTETGLTHTWTDTTVTNGQVYYYAVCAYDYGSPAGIPDSLAFYPSENSIPVSRTLRGGLILPPNVVEVRPEPRTPGYERSATGTVQRLSGTGDGTVDIRIVESDRVPDGHTFKLAFVAHAPDSIRGDRYVLVDTTTGDTLIHRGLQFDGQETGSVGAGLLPIVTTTRDVVVDPATSGFRPSARTDADIRAKYVGFKSGNLRRPGYPRSFRVVFSDHVIGRSARVLPFPDLPTKFQVYALTDSGYQPTRFVFSDFKCTAGQGTCDSTIVPDSAFAHPSDQIILIDDSRPNPTQLDGTMGLFLQRFPSRPATTGDTLDINLLVPFGPQDAFTFTTRGSRVDPARAQTEFTEAPYVVPNPYVGSASFEPARFAVSGRGERRMEFRNIPQNGVVRIYTVRGDLVQTLRQDGSVSGAVPWNLRTKDNLDVAPGLYLFHVSAPGVGTTLGKFAIVK